MRVSLRFLSMLDHARKEQMCMDPVCGTCGATPFMKSVELALGVEKLVPWQEFFQEAQYRDLLINQLVALNEHHAQTHFEAIKFFLTRAFAVNPLEVRNEIENRLAATPSGFILARMKQHYEERLARQALSDPEQAKVRREEKKKAKAEIHRKRVEFYRTYRKIRG